MVVSKLIKFVLILLVIIFFIILGILIDLMTLPIETITTTTVAIAPTTTIKETTTTLTTTTPVIIHKSYCKGNKCWLYEGEYLDIVEDDITYKITLKGVIDEDTAVIDVDGVSESFDDGEDKFVKGLGIYLMDVFYLPKEGQVSFVHLQVY